MKTSTKLLTVFFSCIPITLLAYNLILKNEFTAGNFTREYYMTEVQNYTQRNVPPFKHIVINGDLKFDSPGDHEGWKPRISVDSVSKGKLPAQNNTVSIVKEYDGLMRTRVQNDTLYISFHSKAKPGYINFNRLDGTDLVKIEAARVASVKASYAVVTIKGKLSDADSLELALSGVGELDVNNMDINKMIITVRDMAQFNIHGNNNISNLYYSLADSSTLSLNEHPVQHFHADKISGKANIEINDKAVNLQKNLY